MKRICSLIVAGIALLSLPLAAQEKNTSADDEASRREILARNTGESARPSGGGRLRLRQRDFLVLPDAPRPTPFPAPPSGTDEPPGRLIPRWELAAGYSYVNLNPGGPFDSFNNHGGSGSFAYNVSRYLGLMAEFSGYNFERNITGSRTRGSWNTWLFGPRLNFRRDYFVPFVEFLVGGSHADLQFTGSNSQNAFSLAAGGGVDVVFSKHIAWRFAEIDYLMTNFSGANLGASARQDNLRLGTGLVIRFGLPSAPPPPPAPKGPPTASCSATPASVYAGSNETVTVRVNATSPENLPLTYSYTASGGTVEGNGPEARWNPSGVNPGSYTITAKVDDGKGGTASCNAEIRVEEKPHHPPTVSCSANPTTILPGERSTISCNATSPDNLPLTYTYSASSGQISGNGPQAEFDSTGAQPGIVTIKCEVTDSRGDKGEGSTTVEVQQPPPPPQATKVGDCSYTTSGVSRVDNACKRVLDDVALRLKNEPNAKVVVIGYADPKEPRAASLASKRAELIKHFLGEKGIDASRISTRVGEASKETGSEKENRRIEVVFVPEGATY
jgi:outer membrane protein OmpA-like peptidoglycan-associated protein